MRYLHTMLRVRDLDAALRFFCTQLGLVEIRRRPDEKGRYTNVFLAAPQDRALVDASLRAGRDAPLLELTLIGTPRTTATRAISATSPSRSTTSMRYATD